MCLFLVLCSFVTVICVTANAHGYSVSVESSVFVHLNLLFVHRNCVNTFIKYFAKSAVFPHYTAVFLLSFLCLICSASSCAADEDSLEEDGSYSCVHCRLPQHSKEPWTQKPSL